MSLQARFKLDRSDFALDVEFQVPAQGISAIFGPSGCGKTTLLRAIAGLEHCPQGRLYLGDLCWQEGAKFVPTHRRALGYVFQEASLFAHLNVRANLEYGRKRVPDSEQRVALDRAIELLGIAPLLHRRSHQLSGGERQRVAIARALATSPRLLLMDEPLAALDSARKHEIMPYLESLHEELEIPVLYVSHAADEVARLADHLLLMRNGRIEHSGAAAELFSRLDLPLAHGGDAAALVDVVVAGHDEEFQLTYLDFPGGRFSVARKSLPIGHRARLRVAARDVSITLSHQTETSILNIFPAQIEALTPENDTQMTVRLLAGGVPLLARITRKSAINLTLAPGKQVYAQAKAVALLG